MGNGIASRLKALTVAVVTVAGAALAGSAGAVTISEGVRLDKGIALDLSRVGACANSGAFGTNVGNFSGAGAPGSGGASCGDRTALQVKDEATPFPYGRFNPSGGKWIDSNDLAFVSWEMNTPKPLKAFSFALVDAHDQANSHFTFTVDDAVFSIDEREADGTLHWITVLFDRPTTNATIQISTRLNDGYGISDVRVAPVPLPPALALMAVGIAGFGALRLRRSRAA